MKKYILIASSVFFLTACDKTDFDLGKPNDPPVNLPQMIYTDLGDTSITFGKSASFDLDGNGRKDIYFGTLLVGDPILKQDEQQWLVGSSFDARLPVNEQESIPVLKYQDSILVQDFSGFHWYNASSVLLAQKVIKEQHSFWEGDWKDASHRFVPIQLIKEDKLYNGWVEISFNKSQAKVIVHKAGVSKEPNRYVSAGR